MRHGSSGYPPIQTAPRRLIEGAEAHPDALYLRFLPTGEWGEQQLLTWGELARRAADVAAALVERGHTGARALLLFPPGLDLPGAMFGAMFAGVVPVPAYTPDPARLDRSLRRLRAIVRDAGATVVLTTAAVRDQSLRLIDLAPDLRALDWVAVDALPQSPPVALADPEPEDLAFLQYTSGSTGSPKGVEITHANVAHNTEQVWRSAGRPARMHVVGWVPVHHDMGLISTVLCQLWHGGETTLMAPHHFVQRPARWLEVLTATGANYSPAPTFGYDLVARRCTDAELSRLDLSRWDQAVVSAEPVRWASLQAFAARFASVGFRAEAFNPCFGLAETTVIATASDPWGPPTTRALDVVALDAGQVRDAVGGRVLVSSGRALDAELVIADPDTHALLPDDRIGEIWLRSASVGRGYWRRPDATAERFGARLDGAPERGPFLRTGDLGFLDGGELYVTGRRQDLILVGGANVHPHDVEDAAERAHPAVRPGCSAAFGVDRDGTQGVALAVEVDPRAAPDLPALHRDVRRAVADAVGFPLDTLVVLPRGRLPKTSSGKIQRSLTRAEWLSGAFEPLAVFARPDASPESIAALWSEILGDHAEGSFFEAGGQSLDLLRLIEQIRDVHGVDVPLEELLADPTHAGMARAVDAAAHRAAEPARVARAVGPQPASAAQQRMWLLHRLDGLAYAVGRWTDIAGPLDAERLARSVRALGERHPGLRTRFDFHDGVLSQDPSGPLPTLERVDLRGHPDPDGALAARALEVWDGFDLEAGRISGFVLAELGPDTYRLLILAPHLTGDGWAVDVLTAELWACYRDGGSAAGLPPLRLTLADVARWERSPEVRARRARHVDAWADRLAGLHPVGLPADRPRPAEPSARAMHRTFTLHADDELRLTAWARARGATPYQALLAVFAALVHRTTGEDELAIGTPTAGREAPGSEDLVGCFVNTVTLRVPVDGDPTSSDLLGRVQAVVRDALPLADAPFAEVVTRLRPQRDASGSPLFRVMFTHLTRARPLPALPGLTLTERPWSAPHTPFDLSCTVSDGAHPQIALELPADRFDPETLDRLVARFRVIARAMPADPRIAAITLDPDAQDALRAAWTGPPRQDTPATLHGLVRRAAARAPDALAVRHGERSLTFGELIARADAVAGGLRAEGVGPGARVVLAMGRSPDAVVALLGVLQAGAAVVLVPPDLPASRQALLRAASRPAREIDITDVPSGPSVPWADDPGAPAFLFFTSGSTGTPNGVAVPHDAFVNRIQWMNRAFPLGPHDVCVQRTPFSFVDAVCEILGPLAAGRPVHVLDDGLILDAGRFIRALGAVGATRVLLVPSVLRALLAQGGLTRDALPALDLVVCSGEALPVELARDLHRALPGVTLLNLYGSTEIAADATWQVIPPDPVDAPIGRPIAGMWVRVEDADGHPCPVGVAGELVVGGAGVALGYPDQPELTRSRFPLRDGARVFRTGDRVLTGPDGALRYLGRLDQQVKIRGARVDLLEVEAAVRAHPGVVDCAAAPVDGGGLGVWVVGNLPLTLGEVRAHLEDRLPDPSVPTALFPVDALPRLPSGKLDRRALRASQPASIGGDTPPRTPREAALAAIWAEALGVARVSVDRGFFELGGHSLLAMSVVAEVERQLGVVLPPVWMLRGASVARIAAWLDRPGHVDAGVVTLQPHGDRTPVFFVHGITGGVGPLAPLARHVHPDRPFYGLEAQGFDGVLPPLDRIEAMAELYADRIEALVTRGPVLLGGYSFGGVVAYEVARRLRARGREVPLLILIDTRAPPSGGRVVRAARIAAGLARGALKGRWRSLRRRAGGGTRVERLAGLPHVRKVQKACMDAWLSYRPGPYAGPVLWLRTRSERAGAHPFHWRDLARDLRVDVIGGNHVTCVRPPHVERLGRRLIAAFDEVDQGVGQPRARSRST